MDVYVALTGCRFDGFGVIGVFFSAQEAMERCVYSRPGAGWHGLPDAVDSRVERWDVDRPEADGPVEAWMMFDDTWPRVWTRAWTSRTKEDPEERERLDAAKEWWRKITDCTKCRPDFDEDLPDDMPDGEVRRRWPRFEGTCPACGFTGIRYASGLHETCGGWR